MMEAMSGNREERFEALFREHGDAVYRYAVRRDPGSAEDVVAEAFLVAWRRLDDIPAEAERAWLLGVSRRVHANARRGDQRREALARRLEHEWRPAEPADSMLHEALACLPPRDQEVLMLVAWDGLDPAGAAQAMGCSRANLAVRLHRARKRLARELERLEGRRPVGAVVEGGQHA